MTFRDPLIVTNTESDNRFSRFIHVCILIKKFDIYEKLIWVNHFNWSISIDICENNLTSQFLDLSRPVLLLLFLFLRKILYIQLLILEVNVCKMK